MPRRKRAIIVLELDEHGAILSAARVDPEGHLENVVMTDEDKCRLAGLVFEPEKVSDCSCQGGHDPEPDPDLDHTAPPLRLIVSR